MILIATRLAALITIGVCTYMKFGTAAAVGVVAFTWTMQPEKTA